MSGFTPGPWWAHKNSAGGWEVLTLRDDYPEMPVGEGMGAYIASAFNDTTDPRTRGKNEANARLIAAAPELLAVARYAVDNPDFDSAELDRMARAAIAKATGGQP